MTDNQSPVRTLANEFRVPVKHIAACLGMNHHHLTRIANGKYPTSDLVRWACEGLRAKWLKSGHGYIHPKTLTAMSRKVA